MDYTKEDRDLLVAIATDIKRVVRAIDGNGQPGLVQDVAVLKQDMKERQEEANALRMSTQNVSRNAAATSGVISLLTLGAALLAKLLGIPVPY